MRQTKLSNLEKEKKRKTAQQLFLETIKQKFKTKGSFHDPKKELKKEAKTSHENGNLLRCVQHVRDFKHITGAFSLRNFLRD